MFMFKVILFLLLFGLIIFYFFSRQNKGTFMPTQTNQQSSASPTTTPIRYVALGDSYTIGQGIEASGAWPDVLANDLQKHGVNIELIANPSRTGWTTQDLINYELPIYVKSKPNFATLLIGVNDWVQSVGKEQFRQNFIAILNAMQKALAKPQNIVVVTIPDFSVTPTGKAFSNGRDIAKGIAEFNSVIIEESKKQNLLVVDIFQVSKNMGQDPSLIAADGLHPLAKEYLEWEKLIFPVAQKILAHN